MKKTAIFASIALVVMILAGTLVYAATPDQTQVPGRYQPPTLTEAQKQELAPLQNQLLDTQKQMMQKYVSWGYMTQWQADQRAAMMKDRMEYRQQQGFIPGMMGGRGMMGGGMMGRGPGQGGPGFGGRGGCSQQAPVDNTK
ncbi:MAG: DUF2680 domain-containing protein [Negativicutes bacterium]|nr:DUF2680 domain-containing protein [Negativicutes bacterium]